MSIDIEKAMEAAAAHLQVAVDGGGEAWIDEVVWEAAFDLQVHLAVNAAHVATNEIGARNLNAGAFSAEVEQATACAQHVFSPRYKRAAVTSVWRLIVIPMMLETARLRGMPPYVTGALFKSLVRAAGDGYAAIGGILDPAEDDDTAATMKRLVEAAGAKSAATGRPVRVFTGEFGDEGDDE